MEAASERVATMTRSSQIRVTVKTREILRELQHATKLSYKEIVHQAVERLNKSIARCKWCGCVECECDAISAHIESEEEFICQHCDAALKGIPVERDRVEVNCATNEERTSVYLFCSSRCADEWEATR